MSIILRKATPEDIPQIAAIEASSFPTPWHEQAFFMFLHKRSRFTVLEQNKKIIGYAVLELDNDDASELDNICIAPASQKNGYSLILMDDIIATSRRLNKKHIWLEVRESNASAIALYKKYGFRTEGVRKNYYQNPTENGLLMTLDL